MRLVKNSEYFDPVIIAASHIQSTIVQPRQEPRRIKEAVSLLEKIVLQRVGQIGTTNKRDETNVRIGPETLATAKPIEENDRLIKKSKFTSSLLHSSYEYLMQVALNIQKGEEQGKNMFTLIHVERPTDDSSFSFEEFNT